MKNIKLKHKEFLTENNLKVEKLPKLLQKRINGFDEINADFQYADEQAQSKLRKQLIRLDTELEEDLFDEFEGQLKNNESIEEDTFISEEKIERKEVPKPVVKIPLTPKPSVTNELILDGFFGKKKIKLKRSQLLEMGWKGKLEDKVIRTGRYVLYKALFSYTYTIKKVNQK